MRNAPISSDGQAETGAGGLAAAWSGAASLLAEHRDILLARPYDGEPTEPLLRRGWVDDLIGLSDQQLSALETKGVDADWPRELSHTLLDFVALVQRTGRIAALGPQLPRQRPLRRKETPRKQQQVESFLAAGVPWLQHARRILDVGSGHGHLTRALAASLGKPVVGLEHNPAIAARAAALSTPDGPQFLVTDVLREGLSLETGDWVVGLHACGELGDAIVREAARSRASVMLVACCLQKQSASVRVPLCPGDAWGEALALPKSLLGLSNLTLRDDGVEASQKANLAARERRLALFHLLRESGHAVRFGAEIVGLNRRVAHGDLASLVDRAFVLRGLLPPSPERVAAAANWAAQQHARARRLSLPRTLLGRAIEVFVLLDRALFLEQAGLEVTIGSLFPSSTSARNLLLLARNRCP